MKHVPQSEDPDDYPNVMDWMADQGLGEVALQVLALEATVQSDHDREERVERELGWTMPYYEHNVRWLVEDEHAQQEMPLFLASVAARFPGPAVIAYWEPADSFTRVDHV